LGDELKTAVSNDVQGYIRQNDEHLKQLKEDYTVQLNVSKTEMFELYEDFLSKRKAFLSSGQFRALCFGWVRF
jgi:hypothetical protein